MQIKTLLKAGSLAFDIFNHQSTQSLTKMVHNGVKRRMAPPPTGKETRHTNLATPRQAPHTVHLQQRNQAPMFPTEPVKKALKYVTPENIQKAKQWQEILKSFISKN